MNKKETIDWFVNVFNNCCPVVDVDYPNTIFYIYDKNYIRLKKLSKITNNKTKKIKCVSGECLFYLYNFNINDSKFLACDYDKIWSMITDCYDYILSDHEDQYGTTSTLIKDIIKTNRLNSMLPLTNCIPRHVIDMNKLFENKKFESENIL